MQRILHEYDDSIAISAKTGQGLDDLLARIETILQKPLITLHLHLPYSAGGLLSLLHEQALIQQEQHDETGTYLTARIPPRLAHRFRAYRVEEAGIGEQGAGV